MLHMTVAQIWNAIGVTGFVLVVLLVLSCGMDHYKR